jgi:hypothetical protein
VADADIAICSVVRSSSESRAAMGIGILESVKVVSSLRKTARDLEEDRPIRTL